MTHNTKDKEMERTLRKQASKLDGSFLYLDWILSHSLESYPIHQSMDSMDEGFGEKGIRGEHPSHPYDFSEQDRKILQNLRDLLYGFETIPAQTVPSPIDRRVPPSGGLPTWLGLYAQHLADLADECWRHLSDRPGTFIATLQSMIKGALFDVGQTLAGTHHGCRSLTSCAAPLYAPMPHGILMISPDLGILSANQAFLDAFGLTEAQVLGKTVGSVIKADGLIDALRESQTTGIVLNRLAFTMTAVLPNAAAVPVRVTMAPLTAPAEPVPFGLLMIVEDVSEEAALKQALSKSETDLLRAQTAGHIGSWHLDIVTGNLTWTPEVFRIFGIPDRPAMTDDAFNDLVLPDDRELVRSSWIAALHGAPYRVQHRIAADGQIRWVEECADIEFDPSGIAVSATGTVQDITRMKAAEARIEALAFYDPLTGLPNRSLFLDRLRQELAAAERHQQQRCLLYLDLDRFKEINDTQGHDAGDRVLIDLAGRLQSILRQEDILARLSGDEFVTIAADSVDAAAHVAERIGEAIAAPFAVNGHDFALTASIGIAVFPEDGLTSEELLKHADIAMYRAKAEGGGFRFYRAEMGRELAHRLTVAHRLEAAIARGDLDIHFQPQVHLPTGRLIGAEALTRWNDPEWGTVAPTEFIPIAEERGLIGALGEWALASACRQIRRWQDRGTPLPGRVAVNVGAKQFEDDRFVERTVAIVTENGITPDRIELELTESGMMSDPQRAVDITRALSAAGFALSIDDFGTGYSSLAYLKRFAANRLKIDISFVRDMLTDGNDHAIVTTIIAMGRSLDIETLAEGVEHQGQADALQALGCHLAQGYHFGQPLGAADFAERWLREPG